MGYTLPQIAVILAKADRTMYKIGSVAYNDMFNELDESLDYNRDIIYIYKVAVEYADNFYVGTDKLDAVVERLGAKIAVYDFGQLTPIYSNATIVTQSVPVGAALDDLSDVTITNVQNNQTLRYSSSLGQWINVGPGAAVRNRQQFTATLNQTVFVTTFPFESGLLDVYLNGVKLSPPSYTTFGNYTITLADGSLVDDIVEVIAYDPATSFIDLSGYVPTSRTLTINGVTYDLSANRSWTITAGLSSVGLSMPSGFTVTNSPLTANGTIAVTGAGTTAQYIRGDGSLATFPTLTGFVPYTGATTNVNLGEFGLTAGQLTLDISPTGTAVVGTTRWNNTLGSSETLLKGGSVLLKNGVDLVARVVNKVTPNTTLTKAAYQAVRVSGAQGQRLAVAYAQANNDANSADTLGLVTETIPTNQEGFIICVGQLEDINTTGSLQGETWVDGDVLYLSPTVPGGITNIKPLAPQHLVVIGYVEYAHVNNGKIYVKIMNGWELGELHDVNTTGVVAGQVLKYNGTIWTPSADAGITGSGAAGQVAYFTGATTQAGSNNLFWDAANARLGIGTNAPAYKLHSVGNAFINGSIFFGDASHYIDTNNSTFCMISSNRNLQLARSGTASLTITSNFNTVLQAGGTITDGGQRLQVMGDAFIKGSGNTSATTALLIQNSTPSDLFKILNNGVTSFGVNITSGNKFIVGPENTYGTFVISSTSSGVSIYGDPLGGWFTGYRFRGSAGTLRGGLFVNGTTDSVNYYTLGPSLTNGLTVNDTTGNISIGSTTDTGQRLQVIGDTYLKGSGSTSATTGFQLENNTGINLLTINNSGFYRLSGSNGLFISMFTTSQGAPSISGTNTQFYNYTTTQAATFGAFSFHGDNFSQTSGSVHTLFVSKGFYPTSGTATHSTLSIAPAINQTGGANGITRGLYVTPTIVAAADWRSIEWSNNSGWGLYGAGTANNQINGNLGIGVAPSAFPATFKVIQFHSGSLGSSTDQNNLVLAYNYFFNGTNTIYRNNGQASAYQQFLGQHIWYTAPSGTAGNVVTLTQPMTLTSAGRLLLGTTTESTYLLDVNGTARVSGDLYVTNYYLNRTNSGGYYSGTSDNFGFWYTGSVGNISLANAQPIVFSTANTERLRITSGGNLLVGTTTDAGYKLDVNGTARVTGNLTVDTNTLFVDATNDSVGIGTLSPLYKFHAVSSSTTIGAFRNSGAAIGQLLVGNTVADLVLRINASGDCLIHSDTSKYLSFGTNGPVERVRITDGGNLLVGTTTDIASSKVTISSTTQGFLPPRMTNAQRTAIGSPAVGLLVYQTDATEGTYEYISSGWRIINGGGGGSIDELQVALISQVYG